LCDFAKEPKEASRPVSQNAGGRENDTLRVPSVAIVVDYHAASSQHPDQRQQWLEIDGFEIGTRESRSIVPAGGEAEYFSSHDVEQIGFGAGDRGQIGVS